MVKVAQKQAQPLNIAKKPDVFGIKNPSARDVRTAFWAYSMGKRGRPPLWGRQESDAVLNGVVSDIAKTNACKQRELEALREKAVKIAKLSAADLNDSAKKNSNKQYLDPEAHLSNINSISARASKQIHERWTEMENISERARKVAIGRIAYEIKPRVTLRATWDAINKYVDTLPGAFGVLGMAAVSGIGATVASVFGLVGLSNVIRAVSEISPKTMDNIAVSVGTISALAGIAIFPLIRLRHYTAQKFFEHMEQAGMLAEQKPSKQK